MDIDSPRSLAPVRADFDNLDVSERGFADLGLDPGGFLIATGPRRAVVQALGVIQLDQGAVHLELDLGSTRIARPQHVGESRQRVVEVRSRLQFDTADIARVHREIAYQEPDVVVVGGAMSSQLDDLRWAADIANHFRRPTIALIATDDPTSSRLLGALGLGAPGAVHGAGPDVGEAGRVRLFAATPGLASRLTGHAGRAPARRDRERRPLVRRDPERGGTVSRRESRTSPSWTALIGSVAAPVPITEEARRLTELLSVLCRVKSTPDHRRYVNTVVYRAADQMAVGLGGVLALDTDYLLGIGIGQHRDDSLLAGDASFPDELLPRRGRRLGVFVQYTDRPGEETQQGYLYLPDRGPAFACPGSDQLPDGTDWDAIDHEECANEHGELAEFAVPRRSSPGLIELEVLIYVGAAAVHKQTVELSVLEGAGAAAKVTYRLLHSFDKLPVLTDRVASIVEGFDHLTINAVHGLGTFSFRFSDTNWSPAAVAVRRTLTDIHFVKVENKYQARYLRVDVPPDDYRAMLRRLAKTGRELFNKIFNTPASAGLAPMLQNEARVRGRPPVVQIARTAQRPFVVPWQVLYDLPMEHPEDDLRTCRSVDEYGPGGSGGWPPPATCPHQEFHDRAEHEPVKPAILCPWGFWGLAHLIEVPEPPPEKRSIDQVVTEVPAAPAVLSGTGAGLDKGQLRSHLDRLGKQVAGFPHARQDVLTDARDLRSALEPTTMDIVYLLSHAEQAGESGLSSALIFRDQSLISDDVAVWARDDWPPDHWHGRRPLVVLNACHTAEIVQSTMAGFVANFVAGGAAGVIGAETLIDQMAASQAMEHFLAEFSTGSTVGEAIRLMRWRLLGRGNLLGFSYTPYCAASLRLRPVISQPEENR